MSFATQLAPDLARAITAPAASELLLYGGHVQTILPAPIRCQSGATFLSLEAVEYRWCDPQNLADRPDTMDLTVIVDERDHLRSGRSSSTAAKCALAFFRVSLT